MKIVVINKITSVVDMYCLNNNSTRTEIAKRLGILKQSLTNIENSKDPKVSTLFKLSYVLNCRIDDLVEYGFENNELKDKK